MALGPLAGGIVLVSDRIADTGNFGIPPGEEDHAGQEDGTEDEGVFDEGEGLEEAEHVVGNQTAPHGRRGENENLVPDGAKIDAPRRHRQENDGKKDCKDPAVAKEVLPSVGDFGRLIVSLGRFLGRVGVIVAHAVNLIRVETFSKR